MSGGHFDYQDGMHLEYILDILRKDIAKDGQTDEYGSTHGFNDYKAKLYTKRLISKLSKLQAVLHAYDWYKSADTDEVTFINKYEKIYPKEVNYGKEEPLELCPFCLKRDELHIESELANPDKSNSDRHWHVECWRCNCDGPVGSTKEEAKRLWNSRS